MAEGNVNTFLASNHFANIVSLAKRQNGVELYEVVNDLLCKCMRDFTECRKLTEAKTDTFDYISNKLAEYGVEKGLSYYSATYESVGSRGDGLGYLADDVDLLSVSKNVFVCLPSADYDPNDNTFIVETENCHPGYCKLRFHRKNKCDSLTYGKDDIVKKDREIYIKSTAIIRTFQELNTSFYYWDCHGPALSSEDRRQDWVLAFQFLNSEDLYKQYLNRDRRWPDKTVLEKLSSSKPCSVVCAQHPNSPQPELDFRLSFATSEKFLFRKLSHTQVACYYMLKVIKCNIDEEYEGEKLIRTYYVKSAFLWLCEKLDPDIWTDDKFLDCVLLCLCYLKFCYTTHKLPQLFIPNNNLIDHLTAADCKNVVDVLDKYIEPVDLKYILGCFAGNVFEETFNQILSRPRRDLEQRIRRLFAQTANVSFDIDYISPLMESDTISYIGGELAIKDEHVFCQALYDTIQNIGNIVSPDMVECLRPLLYRLLADIIHRYPRVVRANMKLVEEFYLKGLKVVYPCSGYDDFGLSGTTHLALFHYLNGDHDKSFGILSSFHNVVCNLDPILSLSILFVQDDLSRTWRDTFLTRLIETLDEYTVAMPIKCTALAIYLLSRCAMTLKDANNLKFPICKVKALLQAIKRNEQILSSAIKDFEIVNSTLQILLFSKKIVRELLH